MEKTVFIKFFIIIITAGFFFSCGEAPESSKKETVVSEAEILKYFAIGDGNQWIYKNPDGEVKARIQLKKDIGSFPGRTVYNRQFCISVKSDGTGGQCNNFEDYFEVDKQSLYLVRSKRIEETKWVNHDYQPFILLWDYLFDVEFQKIENEKVTVSKKPIDGETTQYDLSYSIQIFPQDTIVTDADTFAGFKLIHTITLENDEKKVKDEYFVPHIGIVKFEDDDGNQYVLSEYTLKK